MAKEFGILQFTNSSKNPEINFKPKHLLAVNVVSKELYFNKL